MAVNVPAAMYACICREITEADVRRVGSAGVVTPDRLITVLGLDDAACCGRCVDGVEDFVALAWAGARELRELPLVSVDRGHRLRTPRMATA